MALGVSNISIAPRLELGRSPADPPKAAEFDLGDWRHVERKGCTEEVSPRSNVNMRATNPPSGVMPLRSPIPSTEVS